MVEIRDYNFQKEGWPLIKLEVSSDGCIYRFGREMLQRDNGKGYKQVCVSWKDERSMISVHQLVAQTFIPNPDQKPDVNHRNHQTGDNRVENLQWATTAENGAFRKKSRRNTSGYRGVSWNKGHKRWGAYIRKNGKLISLGYYKDAKDASIAYKTAAKELFGEFYYSSSSEEEIEIEIVKEE